MARKYTDGMGYGDLLRNSRPIGEYFSALKNAGLPKSWSGLKMVGSWSDVTFWVDADGNIWEEYVPTFD